MGRICIRRHPMLGEGIGAWMTYLQLWQGVKSRICDWLAAKVRALKDKTLADLKRLRARNTGDR